MKENHHGYGHLMFKSQGKLKSLLTPKEAPIKFRIRFAETSMKASLLGNAVPDHRARKRCC